ncbi:ead/Ea22-like family protein [Salmonella enterica]|nr:ead/Ea22-like family protein [Salmonella enterica]EHK8115940.1 ead/Ea22-like family protein [Salmonella enterica subsp. enterica serovar Irumu]EHF6502756.1 ead/Ea22-like family protein [Salmonella enterica]EHP8497474.1 ead/Ea22-like family protein [Salmonella enterica]EIM8234623.1 ead/Ea22-like family protein [Salmonella enterica subsp. enterica serovar Irumu]
MSNIDKQALREVAEKATPGTWRRASSLFNGITVTPFSLCGEEVTLAHTVEKRDAEFIAAANPATMLALLDELEKAQRANVAQDDHINQQQDRIEQLEKGHQEAAKQINSWRRLAKQNIAERGKDISELETARQRIAELEAKLETADRLQDSAFRDGLKAGFSYGQTDDQSGYEQCLKSYSSRGKDNG